MEHKVYIVIYWYDSYEICHFYVSNEDLYDVFSGKLDDFPSCNLRVTYESFYGFKLFDFGNDPTQEKK